MRRLLLTVLLALPGALLGGPPVDAPPRPDDQSTAVAAAGEEVVSGVYLYVLTDEQGNNGRGKFLLVRK